MSNKVTIIGIILIVIILIINSANFIIKPRKLYILKEETIPSEIIFNSPDYIIRKYEDSNELFHDIHKIITEKEFNKIEVGMYNKINGGWDYVDYGYKRKSFSISSTGEIFIAVS